MGDVDTALLLSRGVLDLIKAREYQKAADKVRAARREQDQISFNGAQRTVHALNRKLLQLRLERQKIEAALSDLGEEYELDAKLGLRSILAEYFTVVEAQLKRKKRTLSNPQFREK